MLILENPWPEFFPREKMGICASEKVKSREKNSRSARENGKLPLKIYLKVVREIQNDAREYKYTHKTIKSQCWNLIFARENSYGPREKI